jgi:uncharacterized membrane protein
MTAARFVTIVLVLGGLFFLLPGIWAFADPQSFYDELAPWEPYNEHFIHDIGAFQIGIGVALLVAAGSSDAKLVALAGGAAGAGVHLASHFIDHDGGGQDSDIPVFGVVAVLLAAAAFVRWNSTKKQT